MVTDQDSTPVILVPTMKHHALLLLRVVHVTVLAKTTAHEKHHLEPHHGNYPLIDLSLLLFTISQLYFEFKLL